MKTLIIKTHDTSKTINEMVITTNDGRPDIMQSVKNANYEFYDQSIGRAPNHIVTRRIDNDLHISFEKEGVEPDLIIEGFYSSSPKQNEENQIDEDAENTQGLIGISEDGIYYNYIPDTGQIYDYVTQLEVGAAECAALGGEGMATPWWVMPATGFPWWVALGLIPVAIIASDDDDDDDPPDTNAPVAQNDAVATAAGNEITIEVLNNDTDQDEDLDPTSVKLITPTGDEVTTLEVPNEGTWTVDPVTGSVTFTPVPDFTDDPTAIDYVVYDEEGQKSNVATVTIDYQSAPIIDIPIDPEVPPIPNNEGAIEGSGDKIVYEGDEAVAGSFTVTAEAGVDSITVGGQEITPATETDPITLSNEKGTLVITDYNAETGIVSYTYDPNVLQHEADSLIVDSHSVSVIDNNGTNKEDSLDIVITDSLPVATNDDNNVTEDSISVSGTVITNDDFGEDFQADPAITAITDQVMTYGSISIAADGNYTYTLDNTNTIVNALETDSVPLVDIVNYTITDGDGDTTTADLLITINGRTDGDPIILIPVDPEVPPTPTDEGAIEGAGDKIVFEGEDAVAGSFTVTAEAGVDTITVDGQEITTATEADPVTITNANGTLVITGYNTETGIVSYTYDPNVLDHQADGPIIDSHAVIVTDDNGVTEEDSLDIAITDSLPIAKDDAVAITENTTAPVTGTVISNDVFGEDGQGSPAVTAVTDLVTSYGKISIAADGSYSYTLDNSNATVNALNGDSTPLQDTISYTITDGDGDTTTAKLVVTINGVTDGDPIILIPVDPEVPPTPTDEGAIEGAGDRIVFEGEDAVAGSFTVTAEAGVDTITVGGQEITTATEADPVTITNANGTLVITGYNTETGIVSYTYDPNVLDHQADGPIIDSHAVIVTDDNGVTEEDSLDIAITDSLPIAKDDAVAITENTTAPVTGTVISNDVFGEDGQGSPAVTAVTDLVTSYGKISIAADGSYSYTLDNSNATVNALNGDSTPLQDTISYTITDGDGDTTTAKLVVTINGVTDGDPIILIPVDPEVPPTPTDEGAIEGAGDRIVFEGEDAVAGSFTVTAEAGVDTITVDGQEITTATEADPVTITNANGTLVITGYNTETGIVSYTYDPNVLDHQADGPIIDSHAVIVTDDNGVTEEDSLDIAITDSLPIAKDDAVAITENTTAPVTGTVISNDVFGEDGQGSPAVTAVTDLVTSYGKISIAADGSYSYTLDNSNATVNALNGDSTPLQDTISYTITDGDGDTTTAKLVVTINGVTDGDPIILIPVDPEVPPTPTDEGAIEGAGDRIVFEGEDAVAGSFTVTAEAGVDTITVGGQEITTATEADPVTITNANGTLVITGYNTETGIVSYTYDPNVLDHQADGPIIDSHAVIVTDDNGVTEEDSLDIAITDSLPIAKDDAVAITENTTAPVTGTVISNDVFGEDGQGSPAVTAVTDLVTSYGKISIAADGSYSYTLDNSNATVNALNGDSTPLQDTISYTITDGDGDTTTAKLVVTINGANDAPVISNIGPVLISEEVLKYSSSFAESYEGLLEGNGSDDNDKVTDKDAITFSDLDNTTASDFSVILSAPDAVVTVQGETVTWAQTGNLFTGKVTLNGNEVDVMTTEIKSITKTGTSYSAEYETTLLHSIDHPINNDEDTLQVKLKAQIYDGTNKSEAVDLVVNVEDDRPTTPIGDIGIPLDAISSNVSIILDTSFSMGRESGIAGKSRADVAADSIIRLLDGYNNIGETRVQLVTFADKATSQSQWLTIDQAKSAIANLPEPESYTNYDDALYNVIQSYDTPGALVNASNYSYFLTDGEPTYSNNDISTLGGNGIYTPNGDTDEGINSNEELVWTQFLQQNSIKSYALGLSSDLQPEDIANLEPVTYNGIDDTDNESELTIAVTDLSQLDNILLSTLPTADKTSDLIFGDFLQIEEAGFGADGGFIYSVTIDATIFTYDRANASVSADQANASYLFDPSDRELTIFTDQGGKLNIDLESGKFGYLSVASLIGYQEDITFVAEDNDGDRVNGAQTLDIYRLIARDDVIITNDGSTSINLDVVTLLANDTIGVSSDFDGVTNVLNGNVSSTDPLVLTLDNSNDDMTFNYSVSEKNVVDSALVTVKVLLSDSIEGGESSDVLIGKANANDLIDAGVGNDVLQGKSGNDLMTGGIGDDVFVWAMSDKGIIGTPDIDSITDFGTGNDKLHLSDLLQNETLDDVSNMQQYVYWDSNNNTLHVSSTGEYAGGVYDGSNTDLSIELNNFNTNIEELITDYIV